MYRTQSTKVLSSFGQNQNNTIIYEINYIKLVIADWNIADKIDLVKSIFFVDITPGLIVHDRQYNRTVAGYTHPTAFPNTEIVAFSETWVILIELTILSLVILIDRNKRNK
ncbi:MAG: hypothetical protein HeimC3_14110 [Candidatus Heimdallarchaeota archaeon LC_3]|nr:MAG: hypothetical protein HeimC3_14110 [Candidatus Heimdallarchaeota archaeon LC_3]